MGILLAFLAGWATANRASRDSHEEVVTALKAVRDSEEMAALAKALRAHTGYVLKEVGEKLLDTGGDGRPVGIPDVLSRVRAMIVPTPPTSGAS
jgi:GTP1/Obg family GTP-binding protein